MATPGGGAGAAAARLSGGSAAVSRPPSPHARQEGGRLVQRQPCNRTNISFGHNTTFYIYNDDKTTAKL